MHDSCFLAFLLTTTSPPSPAPSLSPPHAIVPPSSALAACRPLPQPDLELQDLCHGVLEFAEGRPLGESVLRWLKIHLANIYAGGVDKLSYDGRIAFTENHLEDIFDSIDWPLEGKRWWLGAEDPFQCQAVCMSLTEALRSSSPETMISHIPVHQDGSCNSLQHYAALGRDKLGAIAVNLVAGEKPVDVYSGIATSFIYREESLLSIGKIWQCSKIRSRSNYKTL